MSQCHVFWGSHGCGLPEGHDGPCVCDPCDSEVGCPPYYGPTTHFYGSDPPPATVAATREEKDNR